MNEHRSPLNGITTAFDAAPVWLRSFAAFVAECDITQQRRKYVPIVQNYVDVSGQYRYR